MLTKVLNSLKFNAIYYSLGFIYTNIVTIYTILSLDNNIYL